MAKRDTIVDACPIEMESPEDASSGPPEALFLKHLQPETEDEEQKDSLLIGRALSDSPPW